MKTVTLEVRSPKEAMAEFAQAWKTKKRQKSARIGFASPELLYAGGMGSSLAMLSLD